MVQTITIKLQQQQQQQQQQKRKRKNKQKAHNDKKKLVENTQQPTTVTWTTAAPLPPPPSLIATTTKSINVVENDISKNAYNIQRRRLLSSSGFYYYLRHSNKNSNRTLNNNSNNNNKNKRIDFKVNCLALSIVFMLILCGNNVNSQHQPQQQSEQLQVQLQLLQQQEQQQQQQNNKNNLLQTINTTTPQIIANQNNNVMQKQRQQRQQRRQKHQQENENSKDNQLGEEKEKRLKFENKTQTVATPSTNVDHRHSQQHKIITKTSTSTSISSSTSTSSSSSSTSTSISKSSSSSPSSNPSINDVGIYMNETQISPELSPSAATAATATVEVNSESTIVKAGRVEADNLMRHNKSLNDKVKQRDDDNNQIKYTKNIVNKSDRNNNNSNGKNKITNVYDERGNKNDREAFDNNNADNDDDSDDKDDEIEMLNESEDGYESIGSSTTMKSIKPSLAPHNSAQERERRLMNVLAARRNALHRTGVRSRVVTTSRSATTAIETTSRSIPTDPRSICIRNCTKNFTKRTTASCMRQCSNFSRKSELKQKPLTSDTAKIKEKDTNEILYSDESSHSVLVIAKEQNDTLNHIPDEKKSGSGFKLRGVRRKGAAPNTVTVASTSIEDDDIQPYLYFGQKLPPLKPNILTITSVSEEHPKILEVAVSKELSNVTTTTAATITTTTSAAPKTSTLSAVERSRARFKYNMRGGVSFNNRRYKPFTRLPLNEIKVNSLASGPISTSTTTEATQTLKISTSRLENTKYSNSKEKKLVVVPSSAPLFNATVGEDNIMTITSSATGNLNSTTISTNAGVTLNTIDTEYPKTSTTAASTIITTTENSSTASTASSAIVLSTTSIKSIISANSNTKSTNTVNRTTTNIESTTRNIIDEDRELLRALGPTLTENNDQPNLIIFVNRTSDVPTEPVELLPNIIASTKNSIREPQKTTIPHSVTTESAVTILRTTVLSSIRSTVNVKAKEKSISISTTEVPTTKSYIKSDKPTISYVESNRKVHQLSDTKTISLPADVSSTVAAKDKTLSTEVQRMNIVTMVLAGIGVVPLMAVILYLVRNYILKRPFKEDEDFDVCITDQQPISPVKQMDTKYDMDDDNHHQYNQKDNNDQVDHRKPLQRQPTQVHKLILREQNYNANYMHHTHFNDDKSSIISDREFDRSNIRLKSLLGEGNFGQVWKAEADDLSGHFGATRIVAVKTIKACSTQVSLKEEANIMRKLGSHQNVVTLLGACVETEPHMIIMEYAMRGRLLSLLRAARNATNILPASVPGGRSQTPLSPRTLAGFCLDIACGMEYIAGKRIVHRDLAARNVLLDHNGVCKICDFGMSIDLDAERKRKTYEKNCANEIMRSNFNKFKFDFGGKFIINHWPQNPEKANLPQSQPHQTELKKTPSHHVNDTISRRPALPIRWMAPESLQYHVFTRETDIWAFGIVLWEIATLGSTPYSHISGREVIRRVPLGLRPDLPKEGARHEFYNLMSRCWHKDPQMRPSFTQARLEITRSLHQWIDDDTASNSDYMDVSGFSEDLEHGMVYFNHRISEFECEI